MQQEVAHFPHLAIFSLNEQVVTVEFGNAISDSCMQEVGRLHRLLHQTPFPGFLDTVPAYATLSVFFDPAAVIASGELKGNNSFERVASFVRKLHSSGQQPATAETTVVNMPICYGGKYGPDLEELAQLHQLSPDELVRLHCNATYRVAMIGFVPGFAYLAGMDVALETPRKQVPRQVVPAGSVGIAGRQTGIYPLETPGGWQLVGRTPLGMFNAAKPQPSLLKMGDTIRFQPISSLEFEKIYADKDH
ncbi:5-oxoprolinase subunit PxpB [Hufsiella ginkgonis]|uniref:5-oxoprolinase subunit PxpB n=1 Tax=Hufsiella ginkgonis TaxID=2695274 RepID=A0A7K1Y245_9SPHI|nr:5-oxoprolinase subunit PxpB [Hufsiella ginkgonis]MXV17311.1 5-oxoprolinase subunit PxpB [Hufsiella ginkgonis]